MRDTTTVIIATPTTDRPGVFIASLNGKPVCESHEPLCAAARELRRCGVPPDAVLVMRHDGAHHDAVRGRLGALARLTVADDRHGTPRLRRWKAAPAGRQAPPVQFAPGNDPTPRPDQTMAKGGAS